LSSEFSLKKVEKVVQAHPSTGNVLKIKDPAKRIGNFTSQLHLKTLQANRELHVTASSLLFTPVTTISPEAKIRAVVLGSRNT